MCSVPWLAGPAVPGVPCHLTQLLGLHFGSSLPDFVRDLKGHPFQGTGTGFVKMSMEGGALTGACCSQSHLSLPFLLVLSSTSPPAQEVFPNKWL